MIPTRLLALVGFTTLAALVVPALVNPAGAVATRRFILDDAESLAAGELDGTMVHSQGHVTVGAEVARVELAGAALAFSIARGADGALYVGTGDEGKIFRVRGDDVSLLAETSQLLVASLAVAGDTLYAGTLPSGKVFGIDLTTGQMTELATLENALHIWSLVWHEGRRRLFAATGPEGKVFSIDPQGRAEVYFDSDATHVLSLARDGDLLYAGTSDDAIVYRLRGANQAEVVFDFPGNEITALAFREGLLAVAANDMPAPIAIATKAPTSGGVGGRPGKGRLWRVEADGRSEQIYANDATHFTALAFGSDRAIYAGAGKDGRIYRVDEERASATWVDVDERQVLGLVLDGSRPAFVTGDSAALYRVTEGRPQNALWTSKVLDASFLARWGRLAWRGQGRTELQTRSGNSDTPDDTWTEWSAAMTTSGPVRSPAARFIQVRARLADQDAVIRAVHLYYLPQNQRALVSQIGLKAPTKNDAIPTSSSTYELTWKVANVDEDALRFRLRYRGEAQDQWRPMFREDVRLTEEKYTWDTSGVPDGYYVIEVEASDESANPDEQTLRSRAESEPLLIDNHPPRVEALTLRQGRIVGRAIDSMGPIRRLEIAVDGGDWRPAHPEDGLLDSGDESFAIRLDGIGNGSHIIAVRATDAGGNPATAELTVTLP